MDAKFWTDSLPVDIAISEAKVDQALFALCGQVRTFLEPRWLTLHQSWGDLQPPALSQYMCRYTSLFLKPVLESYSGQSWHLMAGRPPREVAGTPEGQFGFRTASGLFFDHCWVQSAERIVDLTADQFGADAIIITTIQDSRYHPNLEEADFAQSLAKLAHRPEQWLQDWTQYRSTLGNCS